MNRTAHPATTLAIVLALGLGFGISPGFALCSGPEGHLAIEPLHATCCHAESDARSLHALSGCAGGACRDTPLDDDPFLLRSSSDQLQTHTAPAAAALPAAALGQSARASAAHPSRIGLVFPPPPRQQHTTILVC